MKVIKDILIDSFWIMPATPNYVKTGIPYITSKNIKDNHIDFNNIVYITEDDYNNISKNRPILIGDILISMIGTLGETAEVYDEDLPFYGQNMYCVRLDEKKIQKEYFKYYFKSNFVKRKLEESHNHSTQKYLKANHIEELQIKLPDIDTQQKIVNKLNNLSSIINKRKEELSYLDNLVKSRFVELFRQFKAEKTIGELTNICRGASPRPIQSFITKDDNGENWIKIGDVGENDIYITEAEEKVTKAGADKSRRVKPGDFILSNSMSFGRPYILAIDGCVHDGWLIISDYEETFEQLFFYYLLRSDDVQLQFNGSVAGAVVKNLNSDLVRKVKVITPPLTLQKEFVEFAKQIDKSKFVIQKSLDETQKLFDSLMQEYFG